MRRTIACVTFAALICFSLLFTAADWPQWRGPKRDGISQETGLLKEWPDAGPKLIGRHDKTEEVLHLADGCGDLFHRILVKCERH